MSSPARTPEQLNLIRYFGELLEKTTDHEERVHLFSELIRIDPAESQWYEGRYVEWKHLYRWDDALFDLFKAGELDPENYNVWAWAGNIGMVLQRYQLAIECYSNVIERAPEEVYAYKFRSKAYRALDMVAEAERDEQKAYELLPRDINELIVMADRNISLNEYQWAAECLALALSLGPTKETEIILKNKGGFYKFTDQTKM